MIMENLGDYFIILLLIAAAVELVLGIWQEGWGHGWVDGASIFMAVVIITTVNVVNSYNTEQTFKKLMEAEEDNEVQILRNGEQKTLHVDEIVVGDIITCANAVKLRADGIMVECENMKVNESDLTGEKDLLQKYPYEVSEVDGSKFEGKPFAFKGTITNEGTGKMLVTCVGLKTNEGQMEKQMDFTD
jgi:P-type E1-E2 ATPase